MLGLFEIVSFWDFFGKLVMAIILIKFLTSVAFGLYGCFIANALGLNADLKKYGKWAVITGATDGIGKAYAIELAKRGMDIVLISRSPYKLQNVAAEIEQKYSRETKIIDVDFTSTDIYPRIRKELEKLEIGVLINNVGMSLSFPEYFEALDDKFINDLISCNMLSLTMMTKIVLPLMKERKKGMIINVSSLSSMVHAPLLSIYGASKNFVGSFSQNLCYELENTGVELQCIYPSFVVSNMSKIRRADLFVPSAADYVTATLACTGVETMTAGYHCHKLQAYAVEVCTKYLSAKIPGIYTFKSMKEMRARYFKKMAAKKELAAKSE